MNHHHHVVPLAQISLTLSRHPSLSFTLLAGLQGYIPYPHIAAECMFEVAVLTLPFHMWESTGVHHLWARPYFSSSVCLTWIVFVMGGRWPYSWCLVGCCHQDLFNIARSILVELRSSFFSSSFISIHVVHPCSSIDTTAAWKKRSFIKLRWIFSQYS